MVEGRLISDAAELAELRGEFTVKIFFVKPPPPVPLRVPPLSGGAPAPAGALPHHQETISEAKAYDDRIPFP